MTETGAAAPPGAETGAAAPVRWRGLFRAARAVLLAAMVAGFAVWAGDWIHTSLVYVRETDARVAADMIQVSSRVDGWIVELAVTEGDRVERHQTLARVDSREAEIRLRELVAERARVAAERDRVRAEAAMVDRRSQSRLAAERSTLAAAEAIVESFEHEFHYAQREYDRSRRLKRKGVVSDRILDRDRTGFLKAQQQLLRARAQVAAARAQLGVAEAERRQIDILASEAAMLDQRRKEVEARIERQQLDIGDRIIKSPLAGVVSRTFVLPGEYVAAGQRLALIHDPNQVWVAANIRETEIRRLRVGQRVKIAVDAYPRLPFEGRILRIGHAATSKFALLPTPNPSGNFTKVTQRLPIKISVDQRDGVLKPGMMVEVLIDVDGADGG